MARNGINRHDNHEFDPRNSEGLPHAGTFNNNALTMAAGAAALGEVLDDRVIAALNVTGNGLRDALNGIAEENRLVLQFTGMGSILGIHSTLGVVKNCEDLGDEDDRVLELIFLDMLERGYYFARRGFISLMMTIGSDEIQGFLDAFRDVVRARSDILPRRN